MQTFTELQEDIGSLNQRCSKIIHDLLERTGVTLHRRLVTAQDPLLPAGEKSASIILVEEGALTYERRGKVLWIHEPGDILGLEAIFFADSGVYHREFAIRVAEVSFEDFNSAVCKDAECARLWTEYLATYFHLRTVLLSNISREQKLDPPSVKAVSAGETIIREGETGTEVYTLLEGRADVFVNAVKVGEILEDEIFGAIAVLTGTPRTATVVTSTQCLVLALEKKNFLQLIETRPETVQKMIEDMARALISANSKLVAMSG